MFYLKQDISPCAVGIDRNQVVRNIMPLPDISPCAVGIDRPISHAAAALKTSSDTLCFGKRYAFHSAISNFSIPSGEYIIRRHKQLLIRRTNR